MKVEKEAGATKAPQNTCSSDDPDSASGVLNSVKARLSPDRFALLERTLEVRRVIGKVSPDMAELVLEMREQGA
jgi:hypothetical protein